MSRITATACLLFLLALAPLAFAQQAVPALQPAAAAALDKGIKEAEGKDYVPAIQDFQDARKIAGNDPRILLDLGLAEAQIPGRELRAISWFAAYLATAPGASNAAAVQQEIKTLDAASKSSVARLVKLLQATAEEIPSKLPDWSVTGMVGHVDRGENIERVAALWVEAGDLSQALSLAAKLTDENRARLADDLLPTGHPAEIRSLMAGRKCSGTVLDAERWAASHLQIDPTKAPVDNPWFFDIGLVTPSTDYADVSYVAEDAAEHGNAGLALEILQPCVASGLGTMAAWSAIAKTQFEQGDAKGARESLARALNGTRPFFGTDHYVAVTCLQAQMADFTDADKTANKIADLVRQHPIIKYPDVFDIAAQQRADIAFSEGCIAGAYLLRGNIPAAQAAAARIPAAPAGETDEQTDLVQLNIARAQLIRGDKDGAQKTAALIRDPAKRETFRQDSEAFLKDPNYFQPKPPAPAAPQGAPTAQSWIARLDDTKQLNDLEFLDFPGYLKGIQSKELNATPTNYSPDSAAAYALLAHYNQTQSIFNDLNSAAADMADMQVVVDKDLAGMGIK